MVVFCASPYTPQAIGGATPAGVLSGASDGYSLTGGGAQIGMYRGPVRICLYHGQR